jgi:hypothetical protein
MSVLHAKSAGSGRALAGDPAIRSLLHYSASQRRRRYGAIVTFARRTVAVLIFVALAATLVGCSQLIEGVTGITVVGGHVKALVKMCAPYKAEEVHMIPASGQFFLFPHPSWSFKPTGETEVDLGSTASFLKLVGDGKQGFQTSSQGATVGGYLRFKGGDVRQLASGSVLASTLTSDDFVMVDQRGFDGLSAKLCALNPGR